MDSDSTNEHQLADLDAKKTWVLLFSVMVVALCGITYELIVATVSSYLLGNSVYQFSITIGLFMFAMGIGSHLTRYLNTNLINSFVLIEIGVALIGGISSTILFFVFPFYAFYRPAMYILIIVIGTFVGLEIPLLTRILSHARSLKQAIANVLSLDYIGALIGSVAFPILLLPSLGLFRASYAIGLLNIVVATLTTWMFRKSLKFPRLCIGLCVATSTVLIAGLFSSTWIAKFAEGHLFADHVIYTEQTPYQRIVVTKSDRNDEIRLYLDGHLQFASMDEYRYHESLVHPIMSLPGNRSRVLILGGGDGLVTREVLKYDDVERIDLVDIDPAMTRLCNELGPIQRLNQSSLQSEILTIHHTDAFNFVLEAKEEFDRIIIDLPDPHNEVLNKLYSVEFYKGVRRILSDSGYMITQSTSPFFTREAYWCIEQTIRAAEIETLGPMSTFSFNISMPSFGIWGFHVASKQGDVPSEFPIDSDKTKYVTADFMQRAAIVPKDIASMTMPVNSLFEPKLYALYLMGAKR